MFFGEGILLMFWTFVYMGGLCVCRWSLVRITHSFCLCGRCFLMLF